MIQIQRKSEKGKGSCIQVKGERGKVGSGGPHQHPPKSVWGSPRKMNFERPRPSAASCFCHRSCNATLAAPRQGFPVTAGLALKVATHILLRLVANRFKKTFLSGGMNSPEQFRSMSEPFWDLTSTASYNASWTYNGQHF